jgi:hypothetical protein
MRISKLKQSKISVNMVLQKKIFKQNFLIYSKKSV